MERFSNYDYQFELDRVVEALSQGLKSQFTTWIRQLEVPDPATIPSRLLRLDASATFLNFNYTRSLQSLYGVAPSQVLHIHGSADDVDGDLILGHGWNPKKRGSSNSSARLLGHLVSRMQGRDSLVAEFQRKYGKKGLCVLGVSLDEDGWKAVKPFLQKADVPYRIILGDNATAKTYGIESMPDTFLIDRHGRIAAAYAGLVDKYDVEANIQAMLSHR